MLYVHHGPRVCISCLPRFISDQAGFTWGFGVCLHCDQLRITISEEDMLARRAQEETLPPLTLNLEF